MRTLSPLDALLHPVRLACLIHAASVHSEPGSNSPWKKFSFFRKRFDLLIQVLHSKLGDAPESHIRTGTPRTSHCAVQFPKIGGGPEALQILPSFGGVAVTLARPEGFASRPEEKRRKIPPFFRKRRREEGGRRKFGQGFGCPETPRRNLPARAPCGRQSAP